MHPDLVAKYRGQRVPRYTSYPPSPHFSAAVTNETYRGWLAGLEPTATLSLYLHVPFCRSMCWYCGCHTTIVRQDEPIRHYLAGLTREAETVAGLLPDGPRVTHLHFGGGTPTLMPADAFTALMDGLRQRFRFADDAELAIEIDPRTLTAAMPAVLAAGGITRASLGVQSFDPAVQAAINRIQPPEQTAAAVQGLRAAGVRGINLDLIYGLPRQSVASCLDTVEKAVALRPDRLSVFGYAHMPGFKAHQGRIEEVDLPDADERLRQLVAIEEALLAAGYVRIGMDHFARPDDAIAIAARTGTLRRNFQGYTTDGADALIGLGASAIGRLPQGFVANVVPVPGYLKAVEQTGLAVGRGFAVSVEDRLRAELIERVMCRFEVDVAAVAGRYGLDSALVLPAAAELERLVADGLVEVRGTHIQVREAARPLVRSVAALFDAYLDPEGGRHSKAI
ncbi:oxygen-independent coproporphyrinogen III oxidase [Oleisolibacter albus]|uniref:oxygen-independent coproporphyrinogen III oxidase n=1 Tax=Oleisolibacter albus TaxID=2171757 RepID=UPI000DF3B53D|nr:oxygen-independent coproporphyrinogen III oxidase [Oleisolibacter albus]